MTVSISNMSQVWMSNTNTYNAIAMSVSTMGNGANTNSKLINLSIDGNSRFSIDTTGHIVTPYISVDNSGRVSMPYQPYFYSYINCSSSSGIANQAYGTITNGLSWSTNRVTVPIAGLYLITFMNIANDTSAARYDSQILVNGGVVVQALNDAATGYHQKSLSVVWKCAASDYIQFTTGSWYNYNANPGQWNTASITLLS